MQIFLPLVKMGEIKYIVNSLLCFINSICSEHSYGSPSDANFSFYSHEEIKVAKELLCNFLRKKSGLTTRLRKKEKGSSRSTGMPSRIDCIK